MLRRGLARVGLTCFCVGAICAACASFGSDSPGAESDGGPAEDDGGGADGPMTTPPPPSPTDGGSDAFCADASWVCDDFDQPPTSWPLPTWAVAAGSDASAITLVSDAAAPSAPNAARFSTPPGAGVTAYLTSSHAGTITGVHCSFQIFFPSPPSVVLDIFAVRLGPTGNEYGFALTAGPSAAIFAFDQLASIGVLPANTWTRVEVEYEMGHGVRVRVAGADIDAGIDGGASAPSTASGTLQFGVSHSASDGTEEIAYYDDVRCDAY